MAHWLYGGIVLILFFSGQPGGPTIEESTGESSAIAVVSGGAAAKVASTGADAGVGAGQGAAAATVASVGADAGAAVLTGAAAGVVGSDGFASGQSSATAEGEDIRPVIIEDTEGFADGSSTGVGVSGRTVTSAAVASGTSTASAVSGAIVASQGLAVSGSPVVGRGEGRRLRTERVNYYGTPKIRASKSNPVLMGRLIRHSTR